MTADRGFQIEQLWMPRRWRWALIALCTLILCSCRAPATTAPPTLPQQAFAGPSMPSPEGCPCPEGSAAPWSPPGLSQPWPQDEYLADGGDQGLPVAVSPDWRVEGLEPEDTVAHFDTVDGRTLVQASNPVFIYAPRFGSVRKVVGLVQEEQIDQPGGVGQPVQAVRCDDLQLIASSKQQVEAIRQNSNLPPIIYRSKVGDGALSNVQTPGSFQDAFQPYENLKIIREGTAQASERALLAKGVAAAIVWTDTESVEIMLDHQSAAAEVTDRGACEIYSVDEGPACPRIRIVKIASTQFAQPGDYVDFTLRFDNVGNQPIGNVTIIDSLTTRLEYVADSQQSKLESSFNTKPNEAGSEVLRWEITDPLPVGSGGVIRFRCRVR